MDMEVCQFQMLNSLLKMLVHAVLVSNFVKSSLHDVVNNRLGPVMVPGWKCLNKAVIVLSRLEVVNPSRS